MFEITTENWTRQLDNLVNEEIDELIVKKGDFMEFREVWLVHPEKKQVYGTASLGGDILYRKVTKEE